ncbi:MAG: HAMP domain-containing histidine kinase [Actinobacteria bacterium]|nr:HAMP domain-containing histidine kinase [Actinomycetota bacterium]
MTLRTRLVAALVVLSAVGLVLFGAVTYGLYQRSLLDQLDRQLTGLARPQSYRLAALVAEGAVSGTCSSKAPASPGPPRGIPRGGFGAGQGLDAFSALYVAGQRVACVSAIVATGKPDVPAAMGDAEQPRFATVGSASGSGSWRVFAQPVDFAPRDVELAGMGRSVTDAVVVVAVRTSGVDESMRRLAVIEIISGACLLVALAGGAWLILRRGLRPLEQMATSAASITAGDLSRRVEQADGRTEVAQLGLALNTMLDGIEVAFVEREATERRLRQFLADASHELRTPITSIQGFAELYRLGGPERTPDLPVIMGRIESESKRMHTLVDDLLLLAELDRVRPVRFDPVDLSVLAADACSDLVAFEPGRRFVLDAPEPIVVPGDTDHLRQAIVNLVTNAVRHTPSGTAVEVRVGGDAATARVAVRDHGPGMDETGLEHAFDRFWQADPSRAGSGSGLGLSIVAGIAAEHGGRVFVENVADGGARFTIEVPRIGVAGGPARSDSQTA